MIQTTWQAKPAFPCTQHAPPEVLPSVFTLWTVRISPNLLWAQLALILPGISVTFLCKDDVKVQGSRELGHDIHFLETIEKACKEGLKFNPNKCFIKTQQIEYFGHIITPQRVKPYPKKVKTITALAAPKDREGVQSLMWTVNNYVKMQQPLCMYQWYVKGTEHHQEWHCHENKPAIIEADASLKDIGAVLIQDSKPMRFLSEALTPAEAYYSNIEQELFAVLFACEKLHRYTFGQKSLCTWITSPGRPSFTNQSA